MTQTDTHFWSYRTQFFSEREMCHTKVVEKIKTHILCLVTFFRKSWHVSNNVEKRSLAGETKDDNMANEHFTLDT